MTVESMGAWLDWTVTLGADDGPGSVHGLLGSRTGRGNDFQLRDGTVLGPLNEQQIMTFYADSWRVAPGESLLDDTLGRFVQAIAATPTGNALDTSAAHGTGMEPGSDFLAVNGLNPPR
jgi:hypothetical protein